MECWKFHLFLWSHKPLRSGEKDFLAYLIFSFGIKDVPLKVKHYRVAKIWNSMSKHRFAASLMELVKLFIFYFFFFIQYSVADLQVHGSFGGDIFLNSPWNSRKAKKIVLSTCFCIQVNWMISSIFFTQGSEGILNWEHWLQILDKTELCVEYPHHPPHHNQYFKNEMLNM